MVSVLVEVRVNFNNLDDTDVQITWRLIYSLFSHSHHLVFIIKHSKFILWKL